MLEILITFYKSIIHDTLISWNTECVSSTDENHYAKVKASVDILISSTLRLNIFRL